MARITTMMATKATVVVAPFLLAAAMVMSVVTVLHHWLLGAYTYLRNHTDISGNRF